MKQLLLLVAFCFTLQSFAQKKGKSTIPVDTSLQSYEDLFEELDNLLNSVTTPRSFGIASVSVGRGFFNYPTRTGDSARASSRMVYSPSVSYFHKSGAGIAAEVDMMHDGQKLNLYQAALTASYDYLQNKTIATGLSLTRYFTKKDLPFYTSPLLNETFVYLTYRKSNFRPSVNLHYGWGSYKSVTEQEEKIRNIRITRTITTVNKVADFNLTASIRYQFSWHNTLTGSDVLKFTPQLSFISGTQQFGFNQVSNITTSKGSSGKNSTFRTENLVLNDNMKFQPLSVTTFLKTEYAKGRFFIQPAVAFDYYFPASSDNLSFSFLINTGMTFN